MQPSVFQHNDRQMGRRCDGIFTIKQRLMPSRHRRRFSFTIYQRNLSCTSVFFPSHLVGCCCLLSLSVMSDSWPLRGLQHARLPSPPLSPGVCLDLTAIESMVPTNHLLLCSPQGTEFAAEYVRKRQFSSLAADGDGNWCEPSGG